MKPETGTDPDAVAPRIAWRDGELLDAVCPVCGDAAPKPALLDVTTLGTKRRALTLVTCATCSLRLFPALRDPISFADGTEAAAIAQYELAIGLHGSIDCLARIDPRRVGPVPAKPVRFLDVGCGTGFTLDWARHMYGWEVLGVDTSAMAAIAPRELGVPVVHGLLGQSDEVAAGAWDLVFACEVIEHVTDPAAFLAAVRTALAPDGTFLMRTPAAESLEPGHTEIAMVASLSPGYHTMIHTAASLERTLRAAGFTDVRVLRVGDTLHAAASTAALGWTADARLEPEQVERYLRERVTTLPATSAARLGLLQQLVNHLINGGDAAGAREPLEQLGLSLAARHGAGIRAPADEVPVYAASIYCAAFVSCAMLARLDGDASAAQERFAAAAEVARAGIRSLQAHNALDAGLEINLAIADRARFAALAGRDPDAAAALLPALLSQAGTERPALALTLFLESMAVEAFAAAGLLRDEVRAQLDAGAPEQAAIASDARWSLAMLLLHHDHDYAGAALQFAAAGREALTEERRWSARFHEAYALWYGGDRQAAGPLLREVLAEAERSEAGPATAWTEQARSLLAHSG